MRKDEQEAMFNRLGTHFVTARSLHNAGNIPGMKAELEEGIAQARAILDLADGWETQEGKPT